MSDTQKWRERAVCRPGSGIDPNVFFPRPKDRTSRVAAAKICHTCPVEDDCLAEADRVGEHYGVWGGLSRNVHTGEPSRIGPGSVKGTTTIGDRCGTAFGVVDHLRRNENPCEACLCFQDQRKGCAS